MLKPDIGKNFESLKRSLTCLQKSLEQEEKKIEQTSDQTLRFRENRLICTIKSRSFKKWKDSLFHKLLKKNNVNTTKKISRETTKIPNKITNTNALDSAKSLYVIKQQKIIKCTNPTNNFKQHKAIITSDEYSDSDIDITPLSPKLIAAMITTGLSSADEDEYCNDYDSFDSGTRVHLSEDDTYFTLKLDDPKEQIKRIFQNTQKPVPGGIALSDSDFDSEADVPLVLSASESDFDDSDDNFTPKLPPRLIGVSPGALDIDSDDEKPLKLANAITLTAEGDQILLSIDDPSRERPARKEGPRLCICDENNNPVGEAEPRGAEIKEDQTTETAPKAKDDLADTENEKVRSPSNADELEGEVNQTGGGACADEAAKKSFDKGTEGLCDEQVNPIFDNSISDNHNTNANANTNTINPDLDLCSKINDPGALSTDAMMLFADQPDNPEMDELEILSAVEQL